MIGDPDDVHRSTLQLDDEEHVELGEVHGVDGEEVRGEDALGLRGEKLPSGRPTAGGRAETVSAKEAPDRARRDAYAEASKLALDADTTPAPVLSGDPDDEFDELIVNGQPTRATRGSPDPHGGRRRAH